MNIASRTGGKCCATGVHLYFAKDRAILSCTVDSFLPDPSSSTNSSWSGRDDYMLADAEARKHFMDVVNDNLSNLYPVGGARKAQKAGVDKNKSYMILYEGAVPVTVAW